MSLSDYEYSNRKKKTKRDEFLEIIDEIIPWDGCVGVILPFYYKGQRCRPPKSIGVMLRMYLLQIWFELSDECMKSAIYDSCAFLKFMGHNLLEERGLNKQIFEIINRVMVGTGHMMKGGTIVDATIIAAPKVSQMRTGYTPCLPLFNYGDYRVIKIYQTG